MMTLPHVDMSIFQTILARRSVRKFKAREVDRGTVRVLLEAAVRAPTAIHQEPWAFIIIQDRKLLKSLSDHAKRLMAYDINLHISKHDDKMLEVFTKSDASIFYNAGMLILICGKTAAPYCIADCWLAAENLMLVACAMGLGTCVIGSAASTLNSPEVRYQLDIPDDFSVVAPIILGYPDDEIVPFFRKNPIVLANFPATGSS